jgi:hypothetical protein
MFPKSYQIFSESHRRYGTLFLVYRTDMYLWDVHLKLRKFLVMSALVFFANTFNAVGP